LTNRLKENSSAYLPSIAYKAPPQLNNGQQQLVGVAHALISNPKLILADEPTGNLNSKQGEGIREHFNN